MNTINADTGTPDPSLNPGASVIAPPGTVPSIIRINPQFATTLVWVGLGIGIGIWYHTVC